MKRLNKQINLILSVLFFLQFGVINAQNAYTISGKLIDTNEQPVMFANVALLSSSDSSVITGTITGDTGSFKLEYNKPGNYLLSASFIGFRPVKKQLQLATNLQVDLEQIVMQTKATKLDEVVVKQERLKAKQQLDKTTYFVNSSMQSSSNTGVDILQHIPNVQVDLLQNISLNGSQNIVILVDGIERDDSYLAQIHSDRIDRIEIKNSAGVEFGSEVSGVINVKLKESKKQGISGHVYLNIPTAGDEVFSFPTASLNYTFDKLTLYTSYNGAFSYFDIKTNDLRQFSPENNSAQISKHEDLFQQNWSHKLHLGMDYFYDENNQFNLYGFIRRFSNEQNGSFLMKKTENATESEVLNYEKEDNDMNTSAYASVYYKHLFSAGTELRFDADYYVLQSENAVNLYDRNSDNNQTSQSQPFNQSFRTRLNLRFPLNKNMGAKAGLEQNISYSEDKLLPEFRYKESTSAAYFSANYSHNNLEADAGLRAEYLRYDNNITRKNRLVWSPALHIKYRFSESKNLLFSYSHNIVRPTVFDLNPTVQATDLYATREGNPTLTPAFMHDFMLDYSMTFENSFLQIGLFYTLNDHVIEPLIVSEDLVLKTKIQNAGSIHQAGIRTSGSFKLLKNVSVNPYLKLYYAETQTNDLARNTYYIVNKQALNFETALSAVVMMKHDFSISFSAQYKSSQTRIQSDYQEDALYFVSLEKTIFDRLKLGVTSAIPFKKSFTYRGYNTPGHNFSQTTRDNIQTSAFPVWFKINYSFASGQKTKRIERNNTFEENVPKKGFQ